MLLHPSAGLKAPPLIGDLGSGGCSALAGDLGRFWWMRFAALVAFSEASVLGSLSGLCGVSRTDLLNDELVMLYRWPQGIIIRVLFFVAVVLIAADFGFNAYGHTTRGAPPKSRMSLTWCTWAFWVSLVR